MDVLQELTALVMSEKEPGRIMRLKQMFSTEDPMANNPFEDIHLVLTPLMKTTLDTVINATRKRYVLGAPDVGRRCLARANATFFVEALRGVEFLHSHGWVHGDLKPQIIGISDHPTRAVLLDLGSAYQPGGNAELFGQPQSIQGGSVLYMPPEIERHNR